MFVRVQLRTSQWADAAATMLRFAVACDANGATQSQRRCYLATLVVHLHAHEAEQAAGCLRDCEAVPAFHGSEECLAAVDLLDVSTLTQNLRGRAPWRGSLSSRARRSVCGHRGPTTTTMRWAWGTPLSALP